MLSAILLRSLETKMFTRVALSAPRMARGMSTAAAAKDPIQKLFLTHLKKASASMYKAGAVSARTRTARDVWAHLS